MADAREALAEKLISTYPKAREPDLRGEINAIVDAAETQGLAGEALDGQIQSWILQLPRRRTEWVSAHGALIDLRCLLVGPISRWGKIWRELRRFAGFASAHWAPFVTLVVGLASAFYGVAYARFYARLDVTPDQVGLTSTEIVTQSVLGGVVLVLLFLLGSFCLFLPAVPIKERSHSEKGSWLGVLANTILSLLAIVVLFGLLRIVGIGTKASLRDPILVVTLLFLVASFDLASVGRRPVIRPSALDFSLDRYGIVLTACAVPALLFAILVTFTLADDLGEEGSVGKAVRDPKIGIFPLLGIRAEPALVTWKHPTNSVPHTSCMLYLGSSDGKTTLYDHRRNSTFHIADDELTLQVKGEMTSCEAPRNVRVPSTLPYGAGKLRCEHGGWRSQIDPKYSFEWVRNGHPLKDGKGKAWLLYEEAFVEDSVVYCKVTATTPLGENVATSAPAVVGLIKSR